MTDEKPKRRGYVNRVMKSEWLNMQLSYAERVALIKVKETKARKRLKLLADTTGHTPEQLLARGWFSNVFDDLDGF